MHSAVNRLLSVTCACVRRSCTERCGVLLLCASHRIASSESCCALIYAPEQSVAVLPDSLAATHPGWYRCRRCSFEPVSSAGAFSFVAPLAWEAKRWKERHSPHCYWWPYVCAALPGPTPAVSLCCSSWEYYYRPCCLTRHCCFWCYRHVCRTLAPRCCSLSLCGATNRRCFSPRFRAVAGSPALPHTHGSAFAAVSAHTQSRVAPSRSAARVAADRSR